jgi:hypothetical protein
MRPLSSQLIRAPASTGTPAGSPPWCPGSSTTLTHDGPLDLPPMWAGVKINALKLEMETPVRKGMENPHASFTPPTSPLPLYPSTFDFSASGDPGDSLTSAAAASAASCASTPPTAAYPLVLEKRSAQNMTVTPRPNKRAKAELPFETPPSTPLRPVTKFGHAYVNEFFGFEVKEKPVHKMRELLRVWHYMAARNIAQFEAQGQGNVFGFTNVRVLDRASWDAAMLALGTSLSRAPKSGRELKEPKSCIYEILMWYGGMEVVRSNGASSRNKSLMQDLYTFSAERFALTKARVNDCRMRSQKK